MRIKIFSAQKTTGTSAVIPIQNKQGNVYVVGDKKRYPPVDADSFGIQVVNAGAEAGGKTGTFKFEISHAYDPVSGAAAAPFHTPEDATDIKTNYAFDGAADKTESWSFSPPVCEALRIVLTLSGDLTNGADVYLTIW